MKNILLIVLVPVLMSVIACSKSKDAEVVIGDTGASGTPSGTMSNAAGVSEAICSWLFNEKLIDSKVKNAFDVMVLKKDSTFGSSTTTNKVRLLGNCGNGASNTFEIRFEGSFSFNGSSTRSQELFTESIKIDATGVHERVTRTGTDTYIYNNNDTEAFVAYFDRDPIAENVGLTLKAGLLNMQIAGPGKWQTSRSGSRLYISDYAVDEKMDLDFIVDITINVQAKNWVVTDDATRGVYDRYTNFVQ